MGEVKLEWWCEECRRVRLGHCAHPEFCGNIKELPAEEVAKRRAALNPDGEHHD